jgi:hypothetical protein
MTISLSGCLTVYDFIEDSDLPSFPIELRKGKVYRSSPFTISRMPERIQDRAYTVGVVFRRTISHTLIDCLTIADSLSKRLKKCDGIEPVLDISWRLYSDGNLYAQGRRGPSHKSNASFASDVVNVYVGWWQMKTFPQTFILEVEVNGDAPELDGTKPRIEVFRPGVMRG